MEHKDLKKVQKKLKQYFSYFKHDNILVISEDKTVLPFAYLIIDENNYRGYMLLSLAVDYPYSEKAVELALIANLVRPVALSEQFFIAQSGTTYIGKDAHKQFQIETELPLEDIEPLSDVRH
jgi:hypothetical protein